LKWQNILVYLLDNIHLLFEDSAGRTKGSRHIGEFANADRLHTRNCSTV